LKLFIKIFSIFSFILSTEISVPTTAVGSTPTPTPGMIFSGPSDIGKHNYANSRGEGNGIIYTCRAGHIDLSHVRNTADWTKYAYERIYNELLKSSANIPFKTRVDPSIFHISIKYPNDWDLFSIDQKRAIAHPASVKLAQYVIFHAANWHELLSWYGQRQLFFFSEYASAFSWEDGFSNMMGIHLVGDVLLNKGKDYNLDMTRTIKDELEMLHIFSRNKSISITKTIEGYWYTGWIPGIMENMNPPGTLHILYRNFDIGELDGTINPSIIPNLKDCNKKIHPGYPRPFLREANEYGFTFFMEIEARVSMSIKILKIIYGNKARKGMRIKPDEGIPIILDKMKKEALDKGYKYVD